MKIEYEVEKADESIREEKLAVLNLNCAENMQNSPEI